MYPINLKRLLLTTVFCMPAYLNAAPVLVDFNDLAAPSPGFSTHNFVSHGVSFSPNCHQHVMDMYADPGAPNDALLPSPGGTWLGFDSSGCPANYVNDDYLGPADIGRDGKMFVSMENGSQFDLLSFDFVRWMEGPYSLLVQSSRGGSFTFQTGTSYTGFAFSEPAWRDLEWIVFSEDYSAAYSGIDNLLIDAAVAQIPEPLPGAAWAALIAALCAFRRQGAWPGSGARPR